MTTATAHQLTATAEAPNKGVGCGELVQPPLTGELAWILGRPCFAVARIARLALPPCAGRSPLRRACVLALLRAKGVGV